MTAPNWIENDWEYRVFMALDEFYEPAPNTGADLVTYAQFPADTGDYDYPIAGIVFDDTDSETLTVQRTSRETGELIWEARLVSAPLSVIVGVATSAATGDGS